MVRGLSSYRYTTIEHYNRAFLGFMLFLCGVTDTIIVGQGICGTLLSFELYRRGMSFFMVDAGIEPSSSFIASGLINPVTGKRLVKSWMFDELLAAALDTYRAMERLLATPLLRELGLIQFHKTAEDAETFRNRLAESRHLGAADASAWQHFFRFSHGCGSISPCYIVDTHTLLPAWRRKLQQEGLLLEERFEPNKLQLLDKLHYKGLVARNLIFCEGAQSTANPYFGKLPFSLNKGQVLTARIPLLMQGFIYSAAHKLVPLGSDRYWIGSSFEWDVANPGNTPAFYDSATRFLEDALRVPWQVTGHYAAIRPSSRDYRPFVGMHPVFQNIGILNGMGTKGYSQTPYFARQLADKLCGSGAILPEADVCRFARFLSAP